GVGAQIRAHECGVRPQHRREGGQRTELSVFWSHYRWHVWRLTGVDDRSVISTLRLPRFARAAVSSKVTPVLRVVRCTARTPSLPCGGVGRSAWTRSCRVADRWCWTAAWRPDW